MPIYEYVCPWCHHKEERRLPFSDADKPQACPVCTCDMDRKLGSLMHWRYKGGFCPPGGRKYQDG